jgi:formate hydrogenlyase regulatory protein HycA
MALPEVIPIAHEPDYRTDTIGIYDDGQFFASVTGAYRDEDEHRSELMRYYGVLHLFDKDGNYRSSEIRFLGAGRFNDVRPTRDPLEALLDTLPGRRFGDIAIKPFRLGFDGVVFGLIDESGDHGDGDWAELYPDGLGFQEPWDGEYDT